MTFVALAAMVLAQVGHREPTLDWLVARSDIVVRASVAAVSKEPLPEDRAWMIVTLKDLETLKGRPPETLQFAEHSLSFDRRYEGWKDAGREFLVFLLRNPRYKEGGKEVETRFPFIPYGEGWTLIRQGPEVPEEKGWNSQLSAVFRNNLDVVEGYAEILEATRRVAAAGRAAVGEPRLHKLTLPRSVMEWAGRSGDVNQLYLPVDAQLESLARELIQSPAEVISKRGNSTAKRARAHYLDGYWAGRLDGAKNDDERRQIRADRILQAQSDRDELRVAGLQALVHFRSKENAALLTSLLKDESAAVRAAAAEAIAGEAEKEPKK